MKLVKESINEGLKVLKIPDLAEIASRTGTDYEILLDIFRETFAKEGDDGIKKLFKSATDLDLEEMGHGRYVLKY
jgi:hypothetical protein